MISTTYLTPVFTDSERIEKIEKALPLIDQTYQEFAQKHSIPGYAFGMMVDGQLFHSGSGGFIDIANKIPATTSSMFRIASMTKSFIAMAILQLRDAGKLRLDDPISLYIQEMGHFMNVTTDAATITIRDLLTHTAGLPDDDPWADRKLHATDEELRSLLDNGLFFSNIPGITYEYSNLGYVLLGSIIHKASGISFDKFIAENIWNPLGMTQASWEFSEIDSSHLAHGYRADGKEEKLLPHGVFGALGGMIASIDSFSKYVALHQLAWPPRNGEETVPIKRSSLREMQQPHRFKELVPNYTYPDGSRSTLTKAYGFGLYWSRDSEGRVHVGHSGGLPGFGSNWTILPEYGIGVILLTNLTYAPTYRINYDLLDALIKKAQLAPWQWPPSSHLIEKQKELLKLLPHWENAVSSGIFAENFFLDHSFTVLRKETEALFAKAGPILHIGNLIPHNQLRGYFNLKCQNADLQIDFALTPENPPRIQRLELKI